jgi:hypothetical protein
VLVVEVLVSRRLDATLVFVFRQTDILKALFDVETKISIVVQVLPPAPSEPLPCLFSLSDKLDQCLGQELQHVVFERSLTRIARSNGDEALDQRLHLASIGAPDISGLSFYLFHGIINPERAIHEFSCTNRDRVEEACGGGCGQSSFTNGGWHIGLLRKVIASKARYPVEVFRGHTYKARSRLNICVQLVSG